MFLISINGGSPPQGLCGEFLVVACLCLCHVGFADSYERQPDIDVLHYGISLDLTDQSDSISGKASIQILVRGDAVSRIWLDFSGMQLDTLRVGGTERPFQYRNGRLSFELGRTHLRHEIVQVEITYHGRPDGGLSIQKNHYGRRVFFAENWPDRAHRWFPCIDHPSDKATVTFEVTAPSQYMVVSNGKLDEVRSLMNGQNLTRWVETKPIPTYCMVIGAAEFEMTPRAQIDGVPLSFYAYPQDARAAEQHFRRSAAALQYFDELIGAYPYEKLAQIESTTPLGGMENSSAIFYSEESFRRVPVPEKPVPHEIAHQWFGDSVTEADWDHVWLSEGFATYFDALFYSYVEGPEAFRKIMADAADKIREYEETRPGPIVDPSVTDPTEKLNPLSYEKGAWVLHMLRKLVGDEKFFAGIRAYYQAYESGNALTEDFQRVMESVSQMDLSRFFRQWLYQPGRPDYRVSWQWDRSSEEIQITVEQIQPTPFDVALDVAVLTGNERDVRVVRVSEKKETFRIPQRNRPSSVELDPDGWVLKSIAVRELQ